MNPEIWGPSAWTFLHAVTVNYPECPSKKVKENVKTFMISMGKVLPCEQCTKNFEKHLKQHPISDKVLSSKSELVKWGIDIHNAVNKIKHTYTLSYEDALVSILKPYQSNFTANIIIVAIILLIILFFYYYLSTRQVRK